VPDEAIIFIPGQVSDVCNIPSDQIVDRDDTMPFRQEAIGQMRSEKAGATGYDGNGLGRSRHGGVFLLIQAAVADEQFRRFVMEHGPPACARSGFLTRCLNNLIHPKRHSQRSKTPLGAQTGKSVFLVLGAFR